MAQVFGALLPRRKYAVGVDEFIKATTQGLPANDPVWALLAASISNSTPANNGALKIHLLDSIDRCIAGLRAVMLADRIPESILSWDAFSGRECMALRDALMAYLLILWCAAADHVSAPEPVCKYLGRLSVVYATHTTNAAGRYWYDRLPVLLDDKAPRAAALVEHVISVATAYSLNALNWPTGSADVQLAFGDIDAVAVEGKLRVRLSSTTPGVLVVVQPSGEHAVFDGPYVRKAHNESVHGRFSLKYPAEEYLFDAASRDAKLKIDISGATRSPLGYSLEYALREEGLVPRPAVWSAARSLPPSAPGASAPSLAEGTTYGTVRAAADSARPMPSRLKVGEGGGNVHPVEAAGAPRVFVGGEESKGRACEPALPRVKAQPTMYETLERAPAAQPAEATAAARAAPAAPTQYVAMKEAEEDDWEAGDAEAGAKT